MKTVRVYELQVKHECVPEITPHIDIHHFNPSNGFPHVIKYSERADLHVHHERIKIQEFRSGSLPDHYKPLSGSAPVFTSEYIAIPDDLERLITIKWQGKVDDALSKLSMTTKKWREEEDSHNNYKDMVKLWWDMPWYKRVWSAIKG